MYIYMYMFMYIFKYMIFVYVYIYRYLNIYIYIYMRHIISRSCCMSPVHSRFCSIQRCCDICSCEISQEMVPNCTNKYLELHAQVHCMFSSSRFRIQLYCHSNQNSFEMVSQVVAGCQGSCECNFIQYFQTTINFLNISDIGFILNITEIQNSKNM